jgi:hypothetical protein
VVAAALALRTCGELAATASYRVRAARTELEKMECSEVAGGVTCSFEGWAVCELEVGSNRGGQNEASRWSRRGTQ